MPRFLDLQHCVKKTSINNIFASLKHISTTPLLVPNKEKNRKSLPLYIMTCTATFVSFEIHYIENTKYPNMYPV
jgi:hypothetical protein